MRRLTGNALVLQRRAAAIQQAAWRRAYRIRKAKQERKKRARNAAFRRSRMYTMDDPYTDYNGVFRPRKARIGFNDLLRAAVSAAARRR